MSESVIDIVGEKQFKELISSSDKLIVADFWAERCGPCRMIGPVLHDIADKSEGKVIVAKINVDDTENQQIALDFGVRSIPQVTIFKWGEKVDQFIGAIPPDQIAKYVAKNLV